MLHPAKRKLRYQNQIVLRERELVIEILLEILHRLAIEAKDLSSVRLELGGLGFADVDVLEFCSLGITPSSICRLFLCHSPSCSNEINI